VAVAAIALGVLGMGVARGTVPWPPSSATSVLAPAPVAIVVQPSESIADAIAQAAAGSTVIVEPGEYRERVALKANVRVLSREPRGATLRAANGDREGAIVTAHAAPGAELVGFRIAADSTGVGVLTRESTVRLVDLEVTGASAAALEIGPGSDVTIVGSEIRDNPGTALSAGPDAVVRVSHSHFARNASSDRLLAAFAIAPGASVVWRRNVFSGATADELAGTDASVRSSLLRENWFLPPPAESPGRTPAGRSGRNR
jgi:hypothetical protein